MRIFSGSSHVVGTAAVVVFVFVAVDLDLDSDARSESDTSEGPRGYLSGVIQHKQDDLDGNKQVGGRILVGVGARLVSI